MDGDDVCKYLQLFYSIVFDGVLLDLLSASNTEMIESEMTSTSGVFHDFVQIHRSITEVEDSTKF